MPVPQVDPQTDEPRPEPGSGSAAWRAYVADHRSALVRFGVAAFAGLVYAIWGAPVPHNPAMAWAAIAGAAAYAVLLLAWEPYADVDDRTAAWVVTVTDAGLITLFLAATGGWASPWFPLWYLSIFALSLRFGTEETLTAATGYMAIYGTLAAWQGLLLPNLGTFVVRTSFIYALGALGVLVSQTLLQESAERREYEGLATQLEALASELEERNSLLENTLDATEDGILVTDPEGNIVEWNDQFQKMWNLPDEVLEAQDDDAARQYVLDQLEDPDAFRQRIQDLYARPEETSFDVLTFEDGRIYERYSQPHYRDGEPVGRVWSFRDLTEHYQDIEALEEQTRRLQATKEDLEQFASAVSHDLRTPLSGILGHLDIVEPVAEKELPEDELESLREAKASAERMDTMINDILEFARSNPDDLPAEETDPEAALEAARQNLAHRLEEEDATLEVDDDLPPVRVNQAHLLTVFQNLVGNALEYRGDDPLHVRVEGEERDDGMVLLRVVDNGQGIPENEQEGIFGLFQQGSSGSDTGTGTGLATCDRIVKRYGGTLGVDSEVGAGAAFEFTLPAA